MEKEAIGKIVFEVLDVNLERDIQLSSGNELDEDECEDKRRETEDPVNNDNPNDTSQTISIYGPADYPKARSGPGGKGGVDLLH